MLLEKNFLPAYVISNEDQRWATTVVPNVRKVLTVAGSGDQAMFHTLAGATTVDTFDITINAHAIQDIKFAAIKNISLGEYIQLLNDLRLRLDFADTPTMRNLLPLLPNDTREIINQGRHDYMFCSGLGIKEYYENVPKIPEYIKLRKILTKPFNFILCDLYDLSAKISNTYDFINLSNIFDYCYDAETQAKILRELTDHLNIGGHIAYLPQRQQFDYSSVRLTSPLGAKLKYKNTETNKTIKPNSIETKMILFQRTR